MIKRRVNRIKIFSKIGVYCAAFIFTVVFLFPFYTQIITALKTQTQLFQFPVIWFPSPPNWSIFLEVWKVIPLAKLYGNTYFVIFCVIILNFIIGVPAAYALSRLEVYFKKLFLFLILLSQMFIPVLVILPIFNTLKAMGLINSLFALILANAAFSVAFITLMLKGYFDGIPKEIEDAALVDGCGRFRMLFSIILPICMTGIVVTLIYNAILVNNEFLFANTLITGSERDMMIVALYRLIKKNPYSWDVTWNHVMAAAIFAALPIQIGFICIRKYMVKGLATGAIK